MITHFTLPVLYFNGLTNVIRLERNIAKALQFYLNIKIRDLNLSKYLHLKIFRILPLIFPVSQSSIISQGFKKCEVQFFTGNLIIFFLLKES